MKRLLKAIMVIPVRTPPDFNDFIYLDALKAVKPEAVSITR